MRMVLKRGLLLFGMTFLSACGPFWNGHMRPREDYRDAYFVGSRANGGEARVYFVRDHGKNSCIGEVPDIQATALEFPVTCSGHVTGTVSLRRLSEQKFQGSMKLSNGETQDISIQARRRLTGTALY